MVRCRLLIFALLLASCRSAIQLEFAQVVTDEGTLAACHLAKQADRRAKYLFAKAVKAMRKSRLTGFEPDSTHRMIVSIEQIPEKLRYTNAAGSLQFSEKDIVVVYAERWRNLDMWIFALPAELNPKRVDIPLIAFPQKELEKAMRKKLAIRYKTVSESDFNNGIW
ncbi:MAG: hypothetical protein RMJ44_01355 [Cytophagales bacterium]|nr:hypothetical protein [Bernardetiaceae bacterium]MDW8209707.1 hypothetical protein [Cytophagales bacterium]